MGTRAPRISRRFVALTLTMGLLFNALVGLTAAGAHPSLSHPHHGDEHTGGAGFEVNNRDDLDFVPGVHWLGTSDLAEQTGDLVYVGTGCTPADYVEADVEGEIALVDSFAGQEPTQQCPTYVYKQKMEWAEQAGALGLVQVSDAEAQDGDAIDSGIPGLEISQEDGAPIRDDVAAGETINVTLTVRGGELVPTERVSGACGEDGAAAGVFDCDGIDLLSFVPAEEFGGEGQSDLWGWTDGDDEYVIIGKTNGVAFFRVTDPRDPQYLGELPNPGVVQEVWHDIKVHDNHAFIVSESEPHGMTVFDLTRLRDVGPGDEPQEFDRDAFYPLHSAAHNVEVNTETGYAYIVGGNAGLVVPDHCLSGLHMVDISEPTEPSFAGCYAQDGGPGTLARAVGGPVAESSPAAYVHDTQCVVYDGPDERYAGRELCFNSSETHVAIADVTDKASPATVGVTDYPHVGYTHQGWLTEDHRYLIVNDELDELDHEEIANTRTLVFDVTDLENPSLHTEHFHDTTAITHNNYVDGRLVYMSNYTSGLRVLDTAPIDDPEEPRLEEIGFFDTHPQSEGTTFDGTWSNYPFFASGTIAVSGIDEGLFLLQVQQDRLPGEGEDDGVPGAGPPFEVPPKGRPAGVGS